MKQKQSLYFYYGPAWFNGKLVTVCAVHLDHTASVKPAEHDTTVRVPYRLLLRSASL